MKDSLKRLFIIEGLMLFIIGLNFFIPNIFTGLGISFFLGVTFLILLWQFGFDFKLNVNENRLIINTLIYVIMYFLIIYIMGLVVGFNRTIYRLNFSNVLNNIIPMLVFIVLSEMIRYILVKRSNNKCVILISTLLFILLDLSMNFMVYDFSSIFEMRDFLANVFLVSLARNIFLTISMYKAGYVHNIVYRVLIEMYIFVVPIVPAFDTYLGAVIMVLLPLMLSLSIIYLTKKKILSGKELKYDKYNKVFVVGVFSLLILIVLLNSGIFKYQTLTVGSNSMKQYMSKGDIVLVEKLPLEKIQKLNEGVILVFKYKNKLVAHRVYEKIEKNNTVYFKTKGDNNDNIDNNLVEVDDAVGVLMGRIKYLGLPSIWLQEFVE